MTALELHREHPDFELALILRVIKYLGFSSNDLSDSNVERVLQIYPHFEADPELVVGVEAVCQQTGLTPDRLAEVLEQHRHEIPFLGSASHPMVPAVAIPMIQVVAKGGDPLADSDRTLYTLTEMSEKTGISLASLSKYVKEHVDRIPSQVFGKMRRFPPEAIGVFQQIKTENLGRRGGGQHRAERQRAAVSRRFAAKFAELEEELELAVAASKEVESRLSSLSRRIRRARRTAESAAQLGPASQPARARRSGGTRPDTIVAACKVVLAEAGEPMRVAAITERVITMGTPIKAKNPNVTVSSILSSYEDFRRVRRGYYELAGNAELPQRFDQAQKERSTLEPSISSAPERDASDVLADLRAAVDSAEEAPREAAAPRQMETIGVTG